MKFKQTGSIAVLMFVMATVGCAKKDAALDKPVTEGWIKAHVSSELPKRDISEVDAQKALEKFKLWEASDEISWDERTGSHGNYVFTNLRSSEKDFSIESVKISGLRMIDEDVAFADYFELTNLSATDPNDDVVVKAKTIQFSFPKAEEMIGVFKGIEEAGIDSAALNFQKMFKNNDLNFTMGEGYIDDLSIKADEANFTIDFAGWAEEEGDRKVSMLISDIDGNVSESGKAPVIISLDHLSTKGLDLEYYDKMLANNIAGMNPFEPQVQNVLIDNFKVEADSFFLNMPKLKSWYTEKKNGKFHAITQMPSMKLGFVGEPEEPGLKQFKTTLAELGYETMDFSIESKGLLDETADLVDVEVSRISMKDGFDLNFDYKVSGIKNMMENLGQSMETIDYSDPSSSTANAEMIVSALKALKLHNLSFEFDDNSILDKSFNLVASKQGVGVDLIRQQAKGGVMMSTMAAQSEYQAELSKSFADNLVKLIDESGKFKVEVKPSDDLDIGKSITDYMTWKEKRMAFIQSQMHDESVTEITEPEAFDVDEVLRALNIEFEHSAEE